MEKFSTFDAADYLDNEETIAEYITAALDDPNPDVCLTAVRDVARALGYAPADVDRLSRWARTAGDVELTSDEAAEPPGKPEVDAAKANLAGAQRMRESTAFAMPAGTSTSALRRCRRRRRCSRWSGYSTSLPVCH